MYESFFGLKEKPFSLRPDPAFLYLSKKHTTALALLEYSLIHQTAFSVITGRAGLGKTTLIRALLDRLGPDIVVGMITNTHASYGELMRWVLLAFGLDHVAGPVEAHERFVSFLIRQYAEGRRTLLIIDEAQNLGAPALEELRMLSNINADKDQLLQIMFSGQPPLRDLLRRPDLEQLAQRIAVDYDLEPLSHEDTAAYIRHRLHVAGGNAGLFSDAACAEVYRHTGGIPRLINLLCDQALVYGFAAQAKSIDRTQVNEVIADRRAAGSLAWQTPANDETQETTPPVVTQETIRRRKTESTERNIHKPSRPATPPKEEKAAQQVPETSRPVETNPAPENALPITAPPTGTTTSDEPSSWRVPAPETESTPTPPVKPAVADTPSAPVRPAAGLRHASRAPWYTAAAGVLLGAAIVWALQPPRGEQALVADNTARVTPPVNVNPPSSEAQASSTPPQTAVDDAARRALEEQHNAALAEIEALKRERDAARANAEALARTQQQQRTASTQRDKEISQKLDAATALQGRIAELEASLARERERIAAIEAERAAAEARARAEAEARARAEAEKRAAQNAAASKSPAPTAAKTAPESSAQFTSNPCTGPAARFMSTCKDAQPESGKAPE
jgi:type II secretory pathway predicted ATPase ExeA